MKTRTAFMAGRDRDALEPLASARVLTPQPATLAPICGHDVSGPLPEADDTNNGPPLPTNPEAGRSASASNPPDPMVRNGSARSAELNSAVSQDCILQPVRPFDHIGTCPSPADCPSSFHFDATAPKPEANVGKSLIQQLVVMVATMFMAHFAYGVDAAGRRTAIQETLNGYQTVYQRAFDNNFSQPKSQTSKRLRLPPLPQPAR